jgi:hypothetical protein
VTCRELPEPDPDEPLLRAALESAGAEYDLVAWDGEAYDWAAANLVVPRSSWNYYEDPDAFLAWAERVAAATTLVNPIEVVRRNIHKRYLVDLARDGVPTTPTVLVERGEPRTLLSILDVEGWSDVVIKPAIGARSWKNLRVDRDTIETGEAHLVSLRETRDVLVQPYLAAVEGHGERSLIWIDGALTHSIRKEPRFGDAEESVSEVAIPPPEGAQAIVDAALATIDGELTYARVDVVPDEQGRLVVMELELIEPSLFFAQQPSALERFATALVRRASE